MFLSVCLPPTHTHTHCLFFPLVVSIAPVCARCVSSIPLTSNWCKWKEWRRLGEGWPCYNRGGSPQLITRSLPRCFKLINSSSEIKKRERERSAVNGAATPLIALPAQDFSGPIENKELCRWCEEEPGWAELVKGSRQVQNPFPPLQPFELLAAICMSNYPWSETPLMSPPFLV